jgi:hypothetical protein
MASDMAIMNNKIFYILESRQTNEPLMLSINEEQSNVQVN